MWPCGHSPSPPVLPSLSRPWAELRWLSSPILRLVCQSRVGCGATQTPRPLLTRGPPGCPPHASDSRLRPALLDTPSSRAFHSSDSDPWKGVCDSQQGKILLCSSTSIVPFSSLLGSCRTCRNACCWAPPRESDPARLGPSLENLCSACGQGALYHLGLQGGPKG